MIPIQINCPRCNGLLYIERLPYDHTNLACMNCGNRIDDIIKENQQTMIMIAEFNKCLWQELPNP